MSAEKEPTETGGCNIEHVSTDMINSPAQDGVVDNGELEDAGQWQLLPCLLYPDPSCQERAVRMLTRGGRRSWSWCRHRWRSTRQLGIEE